MVTVPKPLAFFFMCCNLKQFWFCFMWVFWLPMQAKILLLVFHSSSSALSWMGVVCHPNLGFRDFTFDLKIFGFNHSSIWGVQNEEHRTNNNRKISSFMPFDFCFIDLPPRQVCSECDTGMYHKHFTPRLFQKGAHFVYVLYYLRWNIYFRKGSYKAWTARMINWSSSSNTINV